MVEFELVLPNGTVVANVTEDDHDLWFALRVRRASGISYWDILAEFRCRVVEITLLVAQGFLTLGG